MMYAQHIGSREAGFSIIEVTVALALLVTVLIPLSSFTVQFIGERRNERELRALALGRQYMEETLHLKTYNADQRWTADRKWRMRKTVTRIGDQVIIAVDVFRATEPVPYLHLMTLRLDA